MSQDYNSTLNLPKTDFPMRAGLPKSEPVTLQNWEDEKVYENLMKVNEGKPLFILHDGPPYANGDIHLGHALNKILKDFIVRYKNMAGFKAPYVPGWDTHGLPTELKARKKAGIGNSAEISVVELRKMCEEFVKGYINDQRTQFKRLGVIGEWDKPYITLNHEFEAEQIRVFAEMATKGYIYKGLKPVYWCPECKTALAEAEIEYAEDPCHSIYVKFNVTDDKGVFSNMGIDPSKVKFVIWTTTTWTLPANVAICVGPRFEYSVIKTGDEYLVMASELYKSALDEAGITDFEVVATVKGSELEYIKTAHPFLDRESLVIVGEHVTLESGTGCVHTAPGHGVDDYNVCQNYPEIPIICPVDSNGVLTEEAGQFAGLTTDEANKKIAAYLEGNGSLFALKKIVHQYPHCWRCKTPILFRATDQWFCSVDDFKDEAVDAINTVKWIPAWGKDRITSMRISRIGVFPVRENGVFRFRFSSVRIAERLLLIRMLCLLLLTYSVKKAQTLGTITQPQRFFLPVQSVRSAVVLNLIKKKILWMFGSIAVHRMPLFLNSVITLNHLLTFTLRVTTSTEVGSSHHSLHPLLQEAEHLTRLFLLTV